MRVCVQYLETEKRPTASAFQGLTKLACNCVRLCAPVCAGVGFGFSQFAIFGIYSLAFWFAGLQVSSGESTFEDTLKGGCCGWGMGEVLARYLRGTGYW